MEQFARSRHASQFCLRDLCMSCAPQPAVCGVEDAAGPVTPSLQRQIKEAASRPMAVPIQTRPAVRVARRDPTAPRSTGQTRRLTIRSSDAGHCRPLAGELAAAPSESCLYQLQASSVSSEVLAESELSAATERVMMAHQPANQLRVMPCTSCQPAPCHP